MSGRWSRESASESGSCVVALPSEHRAAHWDIAWAGFDVALALLLLAVAVAASRRSPWFEGAATAAATLLFVDAWFDVLTSSTRAEFVVAASQAVLVELPLAALCLLLARDAERRLLLALLERSGAQRQLPLRLVGDKGSSSRATAA